MLLKDLIADVPSKHKRTRILRALGGEDMTVAEVVEKITSGRFTHPLANLHNYPNLGRDSIHALWPLLQAHMMPNVVHSAPQPTTEGFSMANQEQKHAEQADFAINLANQISEALQAGMDIEEIKAVLIETLDEMEAQIADAEEAKENGEGENA